MEINDNHIFIFKTNITSVKPDCKVSETLNNHTEIQQWSVDCEDTDCVLRIVSESLSYQKIIDLITNLEYHCEELV